MKLDTFDITMIVIAIVVALGYAAFLVWRFFKQPRTAQLAQIREWLLWAVTEAERVLGGGTGKLKLRMVYDLFVQRFPWLARVISFELFSELVDDVLDDMRTLISTNEAAKAYVEGAAADGN